MKKVIGIILVTAVLISGCYKPQDSRINLKEGVRSDSLDGNIITRPIGAVFSTIIGEGIEIKSVTTVKNKAGFMEVHVSGYNKAIGTRRFQYKVEWVDSKGLVLDSKVSTWLPVSATAKSSFSFYSVAPSLDAVDFKINTRQ
jgi:uncharacterized protein YcfL